MTDSSYDVTYNSEKYRQEVNIIRMDNNAAKSKLTQPLANELIIRLEIVCDIDDITNEGLLTFRDSNRSFIPKIVPDGYTHISIKILKLNKRNIEQKFDRSFVVTDVMILDKEENLFMLRLQSLDWFTFNNQIVYSSGDTKKTATEMISNLFSRANMKLEKSQNDSLYKFTYIVPPSFGMKDAIDDLLTYAKDTQNSFFFVTYDHNNETYRLKSMNDLISAAKTDTDNVLVLPSPESGVIPPQRTLNELILQRDSVSFGNIVDETKQSIIHDHDYKTRTFTKIEYPRDEMNKFFPKPWTSTRTTRFKNTPNVINTAVRNDWNEKLRTKFIREDGLRKVFYETDTLEGQAFGVLKRYAGETIFIDVDKSNGYYNRVIGPWMLKRVAHIFTSHVYNNTLYACRTDMIDELSKQIIKPNGQIVTAT